MLEEIEEEDESIESERTSMRGEIRDKAWDWETEAEYGENEGEEKVKRLGN